MEIKVNDNIYNIFFEDGGDYIVTCDYYETNFGVYTDIGLSTYPRHLQAVIWAVFCRYAKDEFEPDNEFRELMAELEKAFTDPKLLIDCLDSWFVVYNQVYCDIPEEIFLWARYKLEEFVYSMENSKLPELMIKKIEMMKGLKKRSLLDDDGSDDEAINDELLEIDCLDNDEISDDPEENRCFIFSFSCADCFDNPDDLDNFGNENGRFGINYYYGDE